jgi:hypothetical protein
MSTTLPGIEVPYGSFAEEPVPSGVDANGNPATVDAESVLSDQPSVAYAALSGGTVSYVCPSVVSSALTPGSKVVVNFSYSATAADGAALPLIVRPVTFDGPPLPPEAVALVATTPIIVAFNGNGSNVPSNPSENPLPV